MSITTIHPSVKVYLVGGAVRDGLLGKPVKDNDYVVVGANPQMMLDAGFKQVGKAFPVFLHSVSGEEYALARKETSTGKGTGDFECEWEDVSLIEDLGRRDLTINAMARDLETGQLIDPHGGQIDLEAKRLMAVSNSFSEDPVRVLRLARFLATFGPEWIIEPRTKALIEQMNADGMLETLCADRVWKEIEKVLWTPYPSIFFKTLSFTNLFPEYNALIGVPQNPRTHPEVWCDVHTDLTMQYAAEHYVPEVVFAALCHDFGKPITWQRQKNFHGHEEAGLEPIKDFCYKWKVPTTYRDLALHTCREHQIIHSALGRGSNAAIKPQSILKVFYRSGAFRNVERFIMLLNTCVADTRGRGLTKMNEPYPHYDYWMRCLKAAMSIKTESLLKDVSGQQRTGEQIGIALHDARLAAIKLVYMDLLYGDKDEERT